MDGGGDSGIMASHAPRVNDATGLPLAADEIHLQQPNLSACRPVVRHYPGMGASLPQTQDPLNILLVDYQAMKIPGQHRPVLLQANKRRVPGRSSRTELYGDNHIVTLTIVRRLIKLHAPVKTPPS